MIAGFCDRLCGAETKACTGGGSGFRGCDRGRGDQGVVRFQGEQPCIGNVVATRAPDDGR